MGTLGQYLRGAREARRIDLRDAAQQTRISITYLAALEKEDFAKLPGEVFVRGFLKNYGRFLDLDEREVMKRFHELRNPLAVHGDAADQKPATKVSDPSVNRGMPIEPLIWGAGIVIVLTILLFTALPTRHARDTGRVVAHAPAVQLEPVPVPAPAPDKLYLEVIALESTWVLIRTDASPQKKATLKKGESLIWSAGERFQLSYGDVGAIKLQLNGQELTVNEPKNTVVRDLAITASGVVNRNGKPETAKPAVKRKPVSQPSMTTQ
jgi:transcriptional regulator with XRE-family HTH domain